jgi:DNA polymerase elongation subunit (family B)
LKHAGWILDLYHKAGQMVIWLKKTDDSCVRLTDPWKPKIHVGGSYRDLLDLACRPGLENAIFVERYEKAGDRERSRVLEVEVDGDREAVGLARKLEQVGRYSKFRFYDIDIPSPQMYLYHKGLFPLAFVETEETSRGISWTLKDSRESIDYQLPPLRGIELQIKTEKIRKVRGFDDKLSSVHFTRDEKEILTIDSGDEVDKILGLVEAFRAEDPDVIVTHGGDSFIFPYLARRAQEHGILDQLILGRDISPLRVYEVQGHSYFSYGKILYRETAARLLGRLHVDQRNAYVSADCGLEGLFEVSRTCIMPIQRASRATIGTNMTSLQLYHAVKRDVLIPWNKNQPEELKNSGELVIADRGGFIYEPQIGIHDHVGELDFVGLYPTLMTRMNLSGETVNCTCCPDSTNRVPELKFNICERSAGIVPLSLKILLDKRARYKIAKKTTVDKELKTLYDRRQAALKWILVCCLPPESPVLISQNGKVSYQQIGKIIDQQLGEDIGVFDCPQDLFVAGVDKNLKSKFCRVSKLIKTPSPEKLLRVRMDDGRQVECTANHSFYVLRNGYLVEINADKLSKGDLVPVAKRTVHNTTVSRLDILERVRQEMSQAESDLWRAKSDSLRTVVSSSSSILVQEIAENSGFSGLREAESRIMNLLDSDVGFVAVKEVEQIESSSPFVYCFEISDDENFPAFFTGSGGVLVHNSFGYLGFKNARFGKIDAHIATCAFSRKVLGEAAALAEARGFTLVHGIVDSFWLRKREATRNEYEDLCREIRDKLRLPISFEGIYRWIVFLSSKTDSKVGVLNRYYGIFEDGTLKVRGIDLRRHDTPDIIRQCQTEMLEIFIKARNSNKFRLLIPQALKVLEKFVGSLRDGSVPLKDLVIVRNLSKNPDEYTHQVPQAIAARQLVAQGGSVHAGQQVSYILTRDQTRTAVPPEIVDEGTVYDSERYLDLLCSSAANLLLPLGYDAKYLRTMFKGTKMKRPAVSPERFIAPLLENRPE